MRAFTPELQLQTLFVLNANGRIVSTREPNPTPGPRFSLIRGRLRCSWAVRADISDELAARISTLVQDESPTSRFETEPAHAKQYIALLGGRVDSGPAFTFPAAISHGSGIVQIDDIRPLEKNFRGWTADELPGRSPMLAIMEDGDAVSVCFCARRSSVAAEAGVETATPFRGRGFGTRVTAAWALAIRAAGQLPLYSTSWRNEASLAVARKLRLQPCASDWSVAD